MKKFAVIEENVVINLIVADNKEIAESATGFLCVEYAEEEIIHKGYVYDSTNKKKPFAFPVAIKE